MSIIYPPCLKEHCLGVLSLWFLETLVGDTEQDSTGEILCDDKFHIEMIGYMYISTNQRPLFRSRDQSRPIRGQYSGHVISLDQSEASIQVT